MQRWRSGSPRYPTTRRSPSAGAPATRSGQPRDLGAKEPALRLERLDAAGEDPGNAARIHVGVDSSENVIVRDLTVKGTNAHAGPTPSAYDAKLEALHAFNLGGVNHVLLDNVRASDVYGDFVYISSSRRGQPSEHVAIVRSHFNRHGRQGIAITSGRDVTIRGNDIAGVARSMFDLEPNTTLEAVRDVRIEQNTTGAALNFWIASKGAGNQIGDLDVRGNIMRSATGGLVFVFGGPGGARGPFAFADNNLQVTGAVTDEGAVGGSLFADRDALFVEISRFVGCNATLGHVELERPSTLRLSPRDRELITEHCSKAAALGHVN